MKKNIIAFVAFLFQTSIILCQSVLNLPYIPENYSKYDEYIRQYAPSDSAFNVLADVVNRQSPIGRNAVSWSLLTTYFDLFPKMQNIMTVRIHEDEAKMLSQTPSPDIFYIYEKFAIDSGNTENGYLAIQRLADNYIN